jgi:hypothetical protein
MIGRLGWLAAGAILGVTGYRRASRLVRSIRPAAIPARTWAAIRPGRPGARPAIRRDAGPLRGIGPFVADVRDGMEIYLDRHSGRPGRSLGGQQVAPRLPGQPGTNGGYLRTDNAKEGR